MENKAINTKVDNEADDRRKEIAAMKTQIQQQRDEIRGQQESDTAMVLKQLEKDSGKGTKHYTLYVNSHLNTYKSLPG